MNVSLWLQYAAIGLMVLAAAAFVVRKEFPGSVRRTQGRLALWAMAPGHAGWLQQLGRRVAPHSMKSGQAGCGGCDQSGDCHS